ncbi:MAG: helix-turn-helix domain-containing protein [Flaviflexus sp.]|nr:helix-turn-helix domain-containing protein [Flaviflexus sp.]
MNLAQFREAVNHSFVPLEIETDDPNFSGEITEVRASGAAFVAVRADPHIVHRTASLTRASPHSAFKISLQLEGCSVMRQAGREVPQEPGDLVAYDTSQPYELHFPTRFAVMVIQIPHERIRVPQHLHHTMIATRLTGAEGLGRIVSPFLTSIASNMGELEGPSGELLAHGAVDLLHSLLLAQVDGDEVAADPHHRILLAAYDFIDANLRSPALRPEAVARAVHVSVRHLHSIFSRQSVSVSAYIRSRRLEKCYLDLTNPALADRSVAAIGASWGFPEAAHFSRTFKKAYGISPSRARSRSEAP